MEVKIFCETIIRLARQNKERLIDKLIENLKSEGKFHIIKNIVGYLNLKNIQIKGYEPAKLFLAFDYDEKEIEKMLKEKFNLNVKVIEKNIDQELILGGRLITSNYLLDFSFKNLINKIFSFGNGGFKFFNREIRKRIRKN
jgi:F0F1-type ATP synthase delta subunit